MAPNARPLVLATALLGACALVGPALADNVGVTVTANAGSRQFSVQELDGSPMTSIDLQTGGEHPFATVVHDQDKRVGSGGYQVSASMTNLYLSTGPGAYDYATKVASDQVGLAYPSNGLTAGGLSIPLNPRLRVQGTLASCADPAFASALGLAGPVTDLLTLVGNPLSSLCTTLAGLSPAARTLDTTVNGTVQTITAALPLDQLPFALTGARDAGAFTDPTFALGTVGFDDTAGKAAATRPATSRRIMTGTPGLTQALLDSLSSQLASVTGALPLVAQSGATQTTISSVLAGVTTANAALVPAVNAVSTLTTSQQVSWLAGLTSSVLPVSTDLLSTVTGDYTAYPVLQSTPNAQTPGTYGGTLVVTFVDGVS